MSEKDNMGTVVGVPEVGATSYITTVYHFGLGSNTAGAVLWALENVKDIPPSFEQPLETLRANLRRSMSLRRVIVEEDPT